MTEKEKGIYEPKARMLSKKMKALKVIPDDYTPTHLYLVSSFLSLYLVIVSLISFAVSNANNFFFFFFGLVQNKEPERNLVLRIAVGTLFDQREKNSLEQYWRTGRSSHFPWSNCRMDWVSCFFLCFFVSLFRSSSKFNNENNNNKKKIKKSNFLATPTNWERRKTSPS